MMWILTANLNGTEMFWTGRAGDQFVSTDRSDAFEDSFEFVARKADVLNQASDLHSMVFEARSAFEVGDRIKSFDFEPMTGREDRFVIGTIVGLDAGRFVIDVEFDSTGQDRDQVVTPTGLFVTEFAGRLSRVSS